MNIVMKKLSGVFSVEPEKMVSFDIQEDGDNAIILNGKSVHIRISYDDMNDMFDISDETNNKFVKAYYDNVMGNI
jgi:hypothetical protein